MSSPELDSKTPPKEQVRRRVWRLMEEFGVSRPPRPIYRRIPNFVGAETAARRLLELDEFKSAETVKVNPDSPQRPVREQVLRTGKTLLTPTPRLRGGFLLVKPGYVSDRNYSFAATIKGSFRYGRRVDLRNLPKPDLLVVGSVAVSPDGSRLGKGGGYSELEYAILSELRLLDERTPIATTVHESQIVDAVPMEAHDIKLDIIATPNRTLRTNATRAGRGSLVWNLVTEAMIHEIPVLKELHGTERIKS